MVLEYKSAGRITGNSTDNLVTPTFEDYFTADNWTTSGSDELFINTTTEKLISDNDGASTENTAIYVDLTSVSDTAWTLRYKMKINNFTSRTDTNTQFSAIGLSSTTGNPSGTQDSIVMNIITHSTIGDKFELHEGDGATITFDQGTYMPNTPTTGDILYGELVRVSATEIKCSLYNDQGYSELISTVSKDCPSTVQGLRYLKIINRRTVTTNNGVIDIEFDNVQFWDGVENNTVADFTDDFTGTDDWTDVNTGVEVNVTTDVIDWVADGNLNRMTYNNRTSISDDFILRWEFTTDTATNGSDTTGSKLWVTVSNNTNGSNGLQDFCGIGFFISNTQQQIVLRTGNNVNPKDGGGGIFTTTGAVGTRYYELRRAGNQLTGSIYSDSGYSNLIEKQTITSDPATITGLQYVKIFSGEETDGTEDHTYDGTINIVSLWDGLVSLQSPADNDSKPYEVPTWSTLDELDTGTRKTYMGNKNYVPLNTRFDSYYQHRSPFSILQKQHFWEFFSGKQLSSIWQVQNVGTGTVGMDDVIDGGYKITTGSANNDLYWLTFNSKRQYNFDGCVCIRTFKLNSTSNAEFSMGLGNSNATPATGANQNNSIFSYYHAGQSITKLGTGDATTVSYSDGTTPRDTNWHTLKTEVTPANALLFGDNGLEVTKTTNLPTTALQPRIWLRTAEASTKNGNLRYYEVYNT
jgi:hypothetical protein